MHDQASVDEIAARDVALLRDRRMDQHDVGVTGCRHSKSSARPHRDHFDLDPAFRFEARHQHVEQAAVLRARRRREDDRLLRLRSAPARAGGNRQDGRQDQKRKTTVHSGSRC